MFRAYVALAISHQRKGDAGAAARAMTEVIRMFPWRAVARSEAWGREGEKLYNDLSKQVQLMGRGRLSIAAGHPEAAIFVEGQLRGLGNATLADLIPGRYRLFVRWPGTMGRQYEVTVSPNDDAYLHIQHEVDTSLWVTDSWIGFQFDSESDRGNEGKYAVELARRWTGVSSVVVLAAGSDKSRAVLEGVRYRDGVELRRARIYLDTAESGGSSKLAQFLADGSSDVGLEVIKSDITPVEHARRLPRSSMVVAGTGAVLLLTSTALYFASPDNDHSSPTFKDWKEPALNGFVVGAALAGGATYLYLRRSRSASIATSVVLSAGVASALSGLALYVADEDPYEGRGYVPETYRDSAPLGVIGVVGGSALIGVGIWLLGRGDHEGSSPVVSVSQDRRFVGWQTRF